MYDTVRQNRWLTISPADHEMRFRDGVGEHAGPPAAPGEVYELRLDMAATGYESAAGHRVGVEVSSSAFDRWDRNPNTGHAFGVDTAAEPSVAIRRCTTTPCGRAASSCRSPRRTSPPDETMLAAGR